ncbi:MAG: VOC family protein [Gemmatimonadaceae bacterium]
MTTRTGSAHDGFVIADPEGYLLEFEQFNRHPENDDFVPRLNATATLRAPRSALPNNLGIKATITWLYYKDIPAMQRFYEQSLGLKQVADQGWTKIYAGSGTGYVGLVDERRGMHHWTEQKAVNVSFFIDDIDGWFRYARDHSLFTLRGTAVSDDDVGRYRAFVGYDPEGYYLEFDVFLKHPLNERLLKHSAGKGRTEHARRRPPFRHERLA